MAADLNIIEKIEAIIDSTMIFRHSAEGKAVISLLDQLRTPPTAAAGAEGLPPLPGGIGAGEYIQRDAVRAYGQECASAAIAADRRARPADLSTPLAEVTAKLGREAAENLSLMMENRELRGQLARQSQGGPRYQVQQDFASLWCDVSKAEYDACSAEKRIVYLAAPLSSAQPAPMVPSQMRVPAAQPAQTELPAPWQDRSWSHAAPNELDPEDHVPQLLAEIAEWHAWAAAQPAQEGWAQDAPETAHATPETRMDTGFADFEGVGQPAQGAVQAEPEVEPSPLYFEAIKIAKEAQRASVSLVQRRLRISWNEARNMIELMLLRGDVPMEWASPVYQPAARQSVAQEGEQPTNKEKN